MVWFIFLLFVVGGAFFAYRYLVALEKEIRAEIGSGEESVSISVKSPESPEKKPTVIESVSIDQRIKSIIMAQPGILQTELYVAINDIDKKIIQKELLNLDRSGKISRSRAGNTFQLSVVA